MAAKLKLGELLIQQGKVTLDQVNSALNYQKRWGKRIGECLVDLKYITERDLCDVLSKSLRVPVIDISRLDPGSITKEVLELIPIHTARSQRIVPLAVREVRFKRQLVVATSDPTNYKAFDELQFKTSLAILAMIAPDSDIDWFIRRYYMGETDTLPQNYVSGANESEETMPDFVESISNIFYDAEFTNATKEHRKKTEKKD